MFFPIPIAGNKGFPTQYVSHKVFDDKGVEDILKMVSEDKWRDQKAWDPKLTGDKALQKTKLITCKVQNINPNKDGFPFVHLADVMGKMNDEYWKMSLRYLDFMYDSTSILKYEKDGLCYWHTDLTFHIPTRKLSFTLQLSDPKDYEGGDLQFYDGVNTSINHKLREKGLLTVFPSFTWHQITPITKGTRYALVGWVHGETFK